MKLYISLNVFFKKSASRFFNLHRPVFCLFIEYDEISYSIKNLSIDFIVYVCIKTITFAKYNNPFIISFNCVLLKS